MQMNLCSPRAVRRSAEVAALLAAILVSGMGHAEEPTAADAATETEAKTSVHLKLSLGDSALSAEAIDEALEAELGLPVETTDGASDLELVLQARHVTARTLAARGRIVERSLDLPENPEEQLQVIALLSENLLRDEAGALLAELSASEQAPAASSEMPTEPIPDPVITKEPEFGPLSAAGIAFTRSLEVPNEQ